MVGRGLLAHHGGMSLSSPHHTQQTPAQARTVQRGFPERSQRHGRSPVRHAWRDVEIGSALYSTAPLAIFLFAALLVVGAVWLLALAPTVWMLLAAIATVAAATALVLAVIAMMLNNED